MFDFAWSEIAVIAVVALVVIGPKDLPKVLRTVGTWVGKARAIAREFQSSLDQMIREAELEEVRKQVEQAASVDIAQTIEKTVDPSGELKRGLAEPVSEGAPLPPKTELIEPSAPPAATDAPTSTPPAAPAETRPPAPAKSDAHA
jgi:sec-independent protein translocase protein TatB